MSLAVKEPKSKVDYGVVEPGAYMARVVGIVDLGLQKEKDWKTGEQKYYDDGNEVINNQVWVTFELPTETITIDDEERPRWLSKEYKLSFHEKSSLSQLINAVSPGKRPNSLVDLIGKPCQVVVGITSGGKNKVTAVTTPMKGLTVPDLQNPTQVFDMDDPDMDVWSKLPQFIKDKVMESENFPDSELAYKLGQKADGEKQADINTDDMDDDIPF